MEEGGGGGDINKLPEACISHVFSFTSPRDSCRSAAVSTPFQSAVDSDTVWERFLPPDYRQILDRAVDTVECSSKRELYFRLCDPILIDGGEMSFQLEKSSGAKCYMISARALSIVWGSTPQYWKWISVADTSFGARFAEVAHLLNVCWLEIHGKIESRMLSPKTNYAAYLIFKLEEATRGLSAPFQEASVSVGGHESKRNVLVQPADAVQPRAPALYRRFFRGMLNFVSSEENEDSGETGLPTSRADGWTEVEMGEFFNENGEDGVVDSCLMEVKGRHWKSGVVDSCLMEVKGRHWKSGLTVLGIEVRPKK